jgi:plasmid stabilization system protein ParE
MARQSVVWSPEALEDVDAIAAYIARDSAFYAAAVVQKMLTAAATLNQFPKPVSAIGSHRSRT